jgi:hypothetical protein
MKIVFLDIDGVLNSREFCKLTNPKDYSNLEIWLDSNSISKLNDLIRQTDACVVLSSQWREYHELEDIQEALVKKGFGYKLFDKIPEQFLINEKTLDTSSKQHEIFMWLLNAANDGFTIDSFVILDDKQSHLIDLQEFLVLVNSEVGLTKKDTRKALQILKGKK